MKAMKSESKEVALRGRSRMLDFGVSGREDASDLCVSLQQVALNIGSDFGTSLWEVAPGSNLCVSRRENVSDFMWSLWESHSGMWCTATSCSRSRQCSSKDHSNHLL
ncbi:hypothetical protein YC2023_083600 [Brassica napus]